MYNKSLPIVVIKPNYPQTHQIKKGLQQVNYGLESIIEYIEAQQETPVLNMIKAMANTALQNLPIDKTERTTIFCNR